MRIVIEIDRNDTGVEASPGSAPPRIRVEEGVARAPESLPAETLASAVPAARSAEPAGTNAGAAPSPETSTPVEAPAELLARAATLNALNAGPAPGLVVGSPAGTEVTESDIPVGVLHLGGGASPPLQSGLEEVREGGITDAGAAPM
jgi:hypothetical protein